MKTLTSFAVGIAVPAFIIAGSMATSAFAQDKVVKGAPTVKVLLENDKVKVYETTYKPGDVNAAVSSSSIRINRVLKGGTLERTHADGKKQSAVLKTGKVVYIASTPAYTVKNVGKTVVQLYVVELK